MTIYSTGKVQGISIKTKYKDSELHSNLYMPKLIIMQAYYVSMECECPRPSKEKNISTLACL